MRRRWMLGSGKGVGIALCMAGFVGVLEPAVAADVESVDAQVGRIIDHLARDCRYDLETYCATVRPGGGRLAFCLMAHADKRSSQCEIGLNVARGEAEEIVIHLAQACVADAASLCSGTEPGEGRIAQCLLDQRDALSPPCGELADAIQYVVFPESNQPAVGDVMATESQPETTAEAAGAPPKPASADEILAAVDAKVAAMLDKGKKACAADLEKHCSTVTPGEGRLAFCLIAHADDRSADCESAIGAARAEAESIIDDLDKAIDACGPDIASRCSGTEPGEGRIAQCLMEQRDSLGETCGRLLDKLGRVIFPPANETAPDAAPVQAEADSAARTPAVDGAEVMASLEAKVQGIIDKGRQGCAADLETFCSTVTPGEGRLALCLIAHADKRSAACEQTLREARIDAEALIGDVDRAIEACSPDIASLCSGTEPGEGRIAQCLLDQRESLSPACGRVLDTVGKVIFAPGNKAAALPASPENAVMTGAIPVPPAPPTKECHVIAVSVTDWGEGATKKDARNLLQSRVGSFAAKRGAQGIEQDAASVSCTTNINLMVAGYYTCRARTQVCWSASDASAIDKPQ